MLTASSIRSLASQTVEALAGFCADFSRRNGILVGPDPGQMNQLIDLCGTQLLCQATALPLSRVAVTQLFAEKAPERAERWAKTLSGFPWLLFRCARDLADIARWVYDRKDSLTDVADGWLEGALRVGSATDWQTLLTLPLEPPEPFSASYLRPYEKERGGTVSIADRNLSRSVQEAVDHFDFARAFELLNTLRQRVEEGETGPVTAQNLYEIARMAFLENAFRSEMATGILEVLRTELGVRSLLLLADLRDERALEIAELLFRHNGSRPEDHLGMTAIRAVNPSVSEVLIPMTVDPFSRDGNRMLTLAEGRVRFERDSVGRSGVDPDIRRLVVQVLWRGGGFGRQGWKLFLDLLLQSRYDLTIQPSPYEAEFGETSDGRRFLKVWEAPTSEPQVDLNLLRLAASYGKAKVIFDLLKDNPELMGRRVEMVAALRPFRLSYEAEDTKDLRDFRISGAGMHREFVNLHFLEESLRCGLPGVQREAALEVIRDKQEVRVLGYLDRRPDLQEVIVSEWVKLAGDDPTHVGPLIQALLPKHLQRERAEVWDPEPEADPFIAAARATNVPQFVWKRLPEPVRVALGAYFERVLQEGHTRAAEVLRALNTPQAVAAIIGSHRTLGQNPYSIDKYEQVERVLIQLVSDGNRPARDYLEEVARSIRERLTVLRWSFWGAGRKEKRELRARLARIEAVLKDRTSKST